MKKQIQKKQMAANTGSLDFPVRNFTDDSSILCTAVIRREPSFSFHQSTIQCAGEFLSRRLARIIVWHSPKRSVYSAQFHWQLAAAHEQITSHSTCRIINKYISK